MNELKPDTNTKYLRRQRIFVLPIDDNQVKKRLVDEEMERRLAKHLDMQWCRRCNDWHKPYNHVTRMDKRRANERIKAGKFAERP